MRGIAVAVLLGGCGRVGFTPQTGGDGDGGTLGDSGGCTPWQLRVTNDAAMSRKPSIASDRVTFGIAWEDDRDGNFEIYFARIDAAGTKLGSDARLTTDAAASTLSSIAAAGDVYAVGWITAGAPPSASISLVDAGGITTSAGMIATAKEISLVYTGTELAAITDQANDLYLSHWPIGGSPSPIRITNTATAFAPAITWTGSGFGLAWTDSRGGGIDNTFFLRTNAAGIEIGAETPISTADFGAYDASIAWNGTSYGLTWTDSRTGSLSTLRTSRLTGTGMALQSETPLTDSTFAVGASSIVPAGDGFLIAWDSGTIYHTSLDALGTAGAHVPISDGRDPMLIGLDSGYALAMTGPDGEIYVTRLCL